MTLTLTLLPNEAAPTQSGRLGLRKSSYLLHSPSTVALVKVKVIFHIVPIGDWIKKKHKLDTKKSNKASLPEECVFKHTDLDLKQLSCPFTVI